MSPERYKQKFLDGLPAPLRFDPQMGERGTLLLNLAMPLANGYLNEAAGVIECATGFGWKVTIYVRDSLTIDEHLETFKEWVDQGHDIGIALSGPNGRISDHLIGEAGVAPTTGRYEHGNLTAPQFSDADLVKMINHLKAAILDRLQVETVAIHYIATPDNMISVLEEAGITSLNVLCTQQHFFQADFFGGTNVWMPYALDTEAPSFKTPRQTASCDRTIVDSLWTTRDLLGTYYYHISPYSTHPLDRLRGGEDALEYDYGHFIYDTVAQNSRWNAFGYIQFMMEMWIDLEGELSGYCDMFREFLTYVASLQEQKDYRVVSLTAREIRELYRRHDWSLPPSAEVWAEYPRIAEVNSGYALPCSPGGDAPLFQVAVPEGRYVFSKNGRFFEPLRRFGYADTGGQECAPSRMCGTASAASAASAASGSRGAFFDHGEQPLYSEGWPAGCSPKEGAGFAPAHLPVEIDDFTRSIVSINDVDFQYVRELPPYPRVELTRELWLEPGRARQILTARHRMDSYLPANDSYPRFGVAFWDTVPSRTTLSSMANGHSATFLSIELRRNWHVDRLVIDVSESVEVTCQSEGRFVIRNHLPAQFSFDAIFVRVGEGFGSGGPSRVEVNGTAVACSYDPDSGRICYRGRIPAAGHDLRLLVQ